MADTQELKKIKKIYGERFAKLCRELFPTILEEEGKLTEILDTKFANNGHCLGKDIIKSNSAKEDPFGRNSTIEKFEQIIFKQYDAMKAKVKNDEDNNKSEMTPQEILEKAGYDLYECETEEEIQSFEKYYDPNEVPCTIYNRGRLNRCYCFWAIKKDADKIKREDFKEPMKSDKYSTSVLAIQFNKLTGRVEIISRYNHSVDNPNCTLDNELNNIAPKLEQSFSNLLGERGLKINVSKRERNLSGYTLANDGKYYKYNYEIGGRYYCPGNIIIEGGQAHTISAPEKGILADYFLIDLENKTINVCNEIEDSFTQDLQNIKKIEVIKSDKKEEEKEIRIFKGKEEKPIIIGINQYNKIIRYENENLEEIGDNFLYYNDELTSVKLPKLKQVGNDFLHDSKRLTSIDLPNLKYVGNRFIFCGINVTNMYVPNLEKVGRDFLYWNDKFGEYEEEFCNEDFLNWDDKFENTYRTNIHHLHSKDILKVDEKTELNKRDIDKAKNGLGEIKNMYTDSKEKD